MRRRGEAPTHQAEKSQLETSKTPRSTPKSSPLLILPYESRICGKLEYMFRYILSTFMFVGLVACEKAPILGPGDNKVLASQAEPDCGYLQNAYGQRVSWKGRLPINLQVHESYPNEFLKALESAIHHWNESAGLTLIHLTATTDGLSPTASKNLLNSVHWITEWPEDRGNTQALTTLHWTKNLITEADISINGRHFTYFIDEPRTPTDVHLESLLIHELGHVLGLKHRSSEPSVMWSVLNGGIKRQVLTAADKETLKCEY